MAESKEIKSDNTGKKVDTKFKPGKEWKGNAAGRPPGTYSIVSALKIKLAEIVKKSGEQAGDEFLELWLNKARKERGFDALKEIIHQIDGMPKQPITGDLENPLILKVINYGAKDNNNTISVPTKNIPTGTIDKPSEVQDSGVAQEVGKEQNGLKPADNKDPTQ